MFLWINLYAKREFTILKSNLTGAEKREKVLWEIKDLLAGMAFPFIIMIIFSATIIMFAGFEDETVEAIALIGGEVLIIAAFIIFGMQNGATAYRKYILGEQKRKLNSSDKKSIYRTGEYAVWKGLVIGFATTVPFIIFQAINLIVPNTFCEFILLYACGWAYYPISLLGIPQAIDFVMIILPVGVHFLGYYLGMKKEMRIQQIIAEESKKANKKKKNRNREN
jgi:hypothetical protein